jgi:hypothetical protein
MSAIKYMHHVPGRLRVKGPQFRCQGEAARNCVQAIEALPGVNKVLLNAKASSLTIEYDHLVQSQAALLQVLEVQGCYHAINYKKTATKTSSSAASSDIAGLFGKALMGALAQNTATRLIGALL